MLTADLHYDLPEAAIAQQPAEPRDSARLLVDRGPMVPPEHHQVADLADLLDPGDVLVVNDTRVLPARLHLTKPTGGVVEVLLLEQASDGSWEALVRPSRRVAPGTRLSLPSGSDAGPGASAPDIEVGEILGEDGRRRVVFHYETESLDPTVEGLGAVRDRGDDLAVLDAVGEIPLPPYIHEPLTDPDRYQTVYARVPGSVAAPTAGLHMTSAVLERCRARGVTVATIDLAVGLGTFRPVMVDKVEDHPMHAERYHVPESTQALLGPRLAGDGTSGRVVAVGTTTVRALESWARSGESEGSTDLFIRDGHQFRLVDRLLTNFHVPRSSLLAMVHALVGPRWRDLYAVALAEGYRFLSFGDAMVLDRTPEETRT